MDGDQPQVVRLSQLPSPESWGGIGALLMIGEGRERKPSGAPYQPAYWFDAQSRAVALVTDGEGHPLGYHDPESDDDDVELSRLPEGIAEEARTWFEEQQQDEAGEAR